MKAVIAREPGGPEVLTVVERPVPVPGPGEVLIRVAAAGVNRPDLMQRKGVFQVPPGVTDVLGLEVAGEVVGAGPGVAAPAGRVMALVAGGGYADYCLAKAAHCLAVPDGLSDEEAAALPEGLFTVWHNLFGLGGLKAGESVLVHGGGSGIGTLAIQLAKAFGARVATTAGRPEKLAAVTALGADLAIDHLTEDFGARIAAWTEGRGVDVVLDIVGGQTVARNLAAMAHGGRHVSIAFMAGNLVEIDLGVVMRRELRLTSSTMRPKTDADKAALRAAIETAVVPLIAAGTVRPAMWRTLPLADAAAAHDILERGDNIGKVVLRVGA